jgi:hypothetical protein
MLFLSNQCLGLARDLVPVYIKKGEQVNHYGKGIFCPRNGLKN